MEINLAKLDSLSQRLTSMHATDGVQALDPGDKQTITEAAEIVGAIADRMRKFQKQREELRHELVSIICDALTGKDVRCGCPHCETEQKKTEETAGAER